MQNNQNPDELRQTVFIENMFTETNSHCLVQVPPKYTVKQRGTTLLKPSKITVYHILHITTTIISSIVWSCNELTVSQRPETQVTVV